MDDDAILALAAQAVALETTLFDQECVPDTRTRTFRLLAGRRPVALSAPHAVRQPRRVAGVASLLHRSEPYTGPLAIQLHRATGAWAIYATRPARADPNHAAYSTYRDHGLRMLAARAAPRLVIDLHGTQAGEVAVAVGTAPLVRAGRHQALIDHLVARLAGALEDAVVVDPPHFQANHPYTVAAHCWTALNVPSVQLEISRAYRSPRRDPSTYAALFMALRDIIVDLANWPNW